MDIRGECPGRVESDHASARIVPMRKPPRFGRLPGNALRCLKREVRSRFGFVVVDGADSPVQACKACASWPGVLPQQVLSLTQQDVVNRCLYSSVVERQSCKLKVLGSIPSGGFMPSFRTRPRIVGNSQLLSGGDCCARDSRAHVVAPLGFAA